MMPKTCRHCGVLFTFEEYKYKDNPYAVPSWNRKKYCSTKCEQTYNSISHKKPYKLSETEHNEKLIEINKIIDGEIVHTICGASSGYYFEDIIKDNNSYELQMMQRHVLLSKARKWNKNKKHTLIVAVPEDARKKFDEVYFFNGSELIKIPFSETTPKTE
jgi:hypothetical protein